MNGSITFILALFCLVAFICVSCSNYNEEQQDFKMRALRPPSGIMAMNINKKHPKNSKGDESDSTDWRTAPRFSGIISFKPPIPAYYPYPNPASCSQPITLSVDVKDVNAINLLNIYAFQQPDEVLKNPLKINYRLHTGIKTITLNPQKFARCNGVSTNSNTWRIIIFDSRQRVVTYGDVKVNY
jgi:hypothetical protein